MSLIEIVNHFVFQFLRYNYASTKNEISFDRFGIHHGNSDCVTILASQCGYGNDHWLDSKCDHPRNYICQKDPTSEETTSMSFSTIITIIIVSIVVLILVIVIASNVHDMMSLKRPKETEPEETERFLEALEDQGGQETEPARSRSFSFTNFMLESEFVVPFRYRTSTV